MCGVALNLEQGERYYNSIVSAVNFITARRCELNGDIKFSENLDLSAIDDIIEVIKNKEEKIMSEMNYKMNSTGQYVPEIAYTTDEEEEKLLKKPIGRWGRMWQKWIETEYPYMEVDFVMECLWEIIPREVDIEAEKRWDELDKTYRQKNPRPKTFQEIQIWEKERLLTLEHQVMEEVVFKMRSSSRKEREMNK